MDSMTPHLQEAGSSAKSFFRQPLELQTTIAPPFSRPCVDFIPECPPKGRMAEWPNGRMAEWLRS